MKTLHALFVGTTLLALGVSAESNPEQSMAAMARLYHSGDLDSAVKAARDHLRSAPHRPPELCLLAGRIFIAKGLMAEAETLLKKAAHDFPRDFRIWYLIGETNLRMGDEEEGLRAFHTALELNPDYAPTYLWLAKGSPGDSRQIEWLGKVLVLEPRASPEATEALRLLDRLEGKTQPDAAEKQ